MEMEPSDINRRLLNITAEATRYCQTVENVRDMEKDEFVNDMTEILPRIYVEFITLSPEDVGALDYGYYQNYVEEDWYESVRRNMEYVLGPDDMFLETFEEDMKYSDTPIAVSVSESLADIFQALYNFIMISRETERPGGRRGVCGMPRELRRLLGADAVQRAARAEPSAVQSIG